MAAIFTCKRCNYETIYKKSLIKHLEKQKECPVINEDIDRNGFINAGEDINGNKKIDPVKADIVVSFVSGNKTDKNGQMLLQISYGQNLGRWLAYTLRATTSVAGSEGDRSRSFITDVLESDLANGSFYDAPYGRGACVSKD